VFIKQLELPLVPVGVFNNIEYVREILAEFSVAGVILSGGNDVAESVSRDNVEEALLEFAIRYRIPVLGVCRGMQVIGRYFGCSICRCDPEKHIGSRHGLVVNPQPFPSYLPENPPSLVNSYHSYTLMDFIEQRGLRCFARSDDDVVEGVFHSQLPIVGIAWHPEREESIDLWHKALFLKLFKEQHG
jgi:putative glutamine amidotransferase